MPDIQVGRNVHVDYSTKQTTITPILRDLDECRLERLQELGEEAKNHVDKKISPSEREQLSALFVRTLDKKSKGQTVDALALANLDGRLKWVEGVMLLMEQAENWVMTANTWDDLKAVTLDLASLGEPPARIAPGRLVGAIRGNRPL
jgi:hypothetical protein